MTRNVCIWPESGFYYHLDRARSEGPHWLPMAIPGRKVSATLDIEAVRISFACAFCIWGRWLLNGVILRVPDDKIQIGSSLLLDDLLGSKRQPRV